MSLAEWRRRHEDQLGAPERERARVVFVGDSITQGWQQSEAYRKHFQRYEPLNLGIGGDQTQHVLWRIDQGALKGVKAKVAVLLIGVNNLGNGHSPSETTVGVQAVVGRISAEMPQATIVLLGILPAGELPDDPLRRQVVETNAQLKALGWPAQVLFRDVGSLLLEPDGRIDQRTMADFLHPTAAGYERISGPIEAIVADVLRTKPR